MMVKTRIHAARSVGWFFTTLLCTAVALLPWLPALADGTEHLYASPYWDGYTTEHFDVLLGWNSSGHYWGQTSTWTEASFYQLGASNKGDETCDVFGDTDWNTGMGYTYYGQQAWIEGSGGYANNWWDCLSFHSIESRGQGYYYNSSPYVAGHGAGPLTPFHRF